MKRDKLKFNKGAKFLILVFLFCVFSITLARTALAAGASLYLSPSTGTYTIGNTFSVRVKMNSGGATANAAEGDLIFNSRELQVVNISKTGSIFTLWTTEPSFSNSAGTISFGGGVPSGFQGTSGNIISITFKAKANASAKVNFSSGSVLAADGLGTNILARMEGGIYALKTKIISPEPEKVPAEAEYRSPTTSSRAPDAPVIYSNTHPDADKWYSNNNPEFSWEIPSGTGAVKLLIDREPRSLPANLYIPPILEKKLENFENGVWYFHIQFENRCGWGGITHRKVLIDIQRPEAFDIRLDNGSDSTNPTPILNFSTTDSVSGIEYYELKIGDGNLIPITVAYLEHNPYKMPLQAPGIHSILIKAIDAAGNFTIATTEFAVEPIEKPIITECAENLNIGELLMVKGISKYPKAIVSVFVKEKGEEVKKGDVETDEQGNWQFIYEESLSKGTYRVWAEITDERGAKSDSTASITVGVALPSFLKFGKIAIDYLAVLMSLVALIIVLVFVVFYSWQRIALLKKGVYKEAKEAEESLKQVFEKLRDELKQQIEYFDEKPGLNKKESKIRNSIQKTLNASEKVIGKEIRDIKRELTKRTKKKFRIFNRKK